MGALELLSSLFRFDFQRLHGGEFIFPSLSLLGLGGFSGSLSKETSTRGQAWLLSSTRVAFGSSSLQRGSAEYFHRNSTTVEFLCVASTYRDALAISGRIGTAEASDLRKKVVENRNMIQSSFHDIPPKPDNELLTGLRLLLSKTIEQSVIHDHHNTAMPVYIICTYGDMSLSQALEAIKNDRSQWDLRIKDAMENYLSWDARCYGIHWEAFFFIRKL